MIFAVMPPGVARIMASVWHSDPSPSFTCQPSSFFSRAATFTPDLN